MIKNAILVTLLGILSACGTSSIVVEGSYPSPIVAKIPISIGVIYPSELTEFSYIEYSEQKEEEFNIKSGQSIRGLFDAQLPSMFDQAVIVEDFEEAAVKKLDAVFTPSIEEFQLALPSKTKLDVFEVWVKYNLRLSDIEGNQIADWIVTSYGKTPKRSMQTMENSINRAAVIALRDFASRFSLSFTQVPEIKQWLSQRQE